jgi:hypothetical protein
MAAAKTAYVEKLENQLKAVVKKTENQRNGGVKAAA